MNVFSLACLSKSIFTDALMQELGQDKGRNVSVTAKENSIRGTARSQKPAGIRRKESGNTSQQVRTRKKVGHGDCEGWRLCEESKWSKRADWGGVEVGRGRESK